MPSGEEKFDVVIIGGGFLGLSAAVHLAEQHVRVAVLEANQIGWGASGRTGGQVIAGLKFDPDEIRSRYPDRAEDLIALGGEAPSVIFDLIRRYGIDCAAFSQGWLQPAHSQKALDIIAARQRQWEKLGVASSVLDRSEAARRLGTAAYQGAWFDPRGGNIQPLSYCHGLANAAIQMGVRIYEGTRVSSMDRSGARWLVACEMGSSFVADQVIVCTNAYSDGLIPRLKDSILAANSFQVATFPLSPEKGGSILPGGISASDTRNLLLYFRKDAHGRFIMGGRGPFRATSGQADFKTIIAAALRLYPQLEGEPFEYHWNGRVALTSDFLPHLYNPHPGLFVNVGFNGRGVALTSAMGRDLAQLTLGRRPVETHPFYTKQIKPIPFPGMKRLYISSAVLYYRLKDKLS